jgi:GNAT superfamily N-acetyltransferase
MLMNDLPTLPKLPEEEDVVVTTLAPDKLPDGIRNLICKSWVRAFVRSRQYKRLTDDEVAYYPVQQALVERCLDHPSTHVALAHYQSSQSHVLGYGVFSRLRAMDPNVTFAKAPIALHYVWIRPNYRGIGNAKSIIEHIEGVHGTILRYTHGVEPAYLRRVPTRWVYDALLFLVPHT